MALMHGTLKIRTANTSCDGFFDSVCKFMLETLMKFVRWSLKQGYSQFNHKNYNFLNCDWFKKNSYFPLIHLPSCYWTV